jgi:serine/threonine protein phosphatase PrpC
MEEKNNLDLPVDNGVESTPVALVSEIEPCVELTESKSPYSIEEADACDLPTVVVERPTAAPKSKPEWKQLEPEDSKDSVPHEESRCENMDGIWTVMGASIRGKLHAHTGSWRDDNFAYDRVQEWTILAVADGAGSAPLSRVGSHLACKSAIEKIKLLLEGFSLPQWTSEELRKSALEKIKAFLVAATTDAQYELMREAQRRESSLKSLHTTLLLALHSPWGDNDLVASIQVGDGCIGLVDAEGKFTLLGAADHGSHASETIFLTSIKDLLAKPLDQRVIFCIKNGMQALALMSDGVSDDFFPENEHLWQIFTGSPIERLKDINGGPVYGIMKSVLADPREGGALLDWLRYEKKQSADDRTLLVMFRRFSA